MESPQRNLPFVSANRPLAAMVAHMRIVVAGLPLVMAVNGYREQSLIGKWMDARARLRSDATGLRGGVNSVWRVRETALEVRALTFLVHEHLRHRWPVLPPPTPVPPILQHPVTSTWIAEPTRTGTIYRQRRLV